MAFRNREEAARRLADNLIRYRGRNPVVLAVPRGAAPMARIVADVLGGDLDVVLVCKIAAPENPECALGTVDESGAVDLTDYARHHTPEAYIRKEADRQIDVLRRRRQLYTPLRAPVDLAGRIVIIVDDGIATGASMLAAVRAVRRRGPQRLIVAIPVAAPKALVAIRQQVDEVVCLLPPVPIAAICGFYADFAPVSDEQVTSALARSAETAAVSSPQ